MYCRYSKTSIWDHKQCPLNGGEYYCVLVSLSEVVKHRPLYTVGAAWGLLSALHGSLSLPSDSLHFVLYSMNNY